jgi:hypothetical protein
MYPSDDSLSTAVSHVINVGMEWLWLISIIVVVLAVRIATWKENRNTKDQTAKRLFDEKDIYEENENVNLN